MNKHIQARAEILKEARYIPHGRSRGRTKSSIKADEYWPAPPPANLPVQPTGDCLIWTGRLNGDGYGTGNFPNGVHLAHVQAYAQSRKTNPKLGRSICHLCHRPYCIQPSHLYEGDNKTNSDDRQLRSGKGTMGLVFHKHDDVMRAARYRWPSPSPINDSLLAPDAVEVEHECEYIIPAGDVAICSVCEKPEDPNFHRDSGPKRMQPPDTDRNSVSMVKFGKAVTEIGSGAVLCSNMEVELDLPKNRAERRRRLRQAKKQRAWDGPVLIHQRQGIVRVNDPLPIQVNTAAPFVAPSDGLLVVTVTTSPLDRSEAELLDRLTQRRPQAE